MDIESIAVRDVKECGQKYVTYLTKNDNDELYQYVIVRGTKNWKNIKTSLQYKVSYNEEFGMYLHNGYGVASHCILEDLKNFIDPNAKLNLTGHSYGGVVCCLIASNLQKTKISEINQIVTFGMPQFSTTKEMNIICNELPIIQVQHIRDEIAKFDWNKVLSKRSNRKLKMEDDDNINESDINGNIIYIGQFDDENNNNSNSSIKTRFIHRMRDYTNTIEKHVCAHQQQQD